jgi:hypothetical protein
MSPEEAAAPHFKVTTRHGKSEAIIRPPFAIVTKGGIAKIKNNTNSFIVLLIPEDIAASGQVEEIKVLAGDTGDVAIASAPPNGAYSFKVFCAETFSFAQANSDPEFIVE